MVNPSGVTGSGAPYLRVFPAEGVLKPGQSIERSLLFQHAAKSETTRPQNTINVQSGQGKARIL